MVIIDHPFTHLEVDVEFQEDTSRDDYDCSSLLSRSAILLQSSKRKE